MTEFFENVENGIVVLRPGKTCSLEKRFVVIYLSQAKMVRFKKVFSTVIETENCLLRVL